MSNVRELYVGNLNFRTSEETFIEAFTQFGQIEEACLKRDRETGRSRGFGFITYYNAEDAGRALNAMNGQLIDGRPIRVAGANQDSGPHGRSAGFRGRGGHEYHREIPDRRGYGDGQLRGAPRGRSHCWGEPHYSAGYGGNRNSAGYGARNPAYHQAQGGLNSGDSGTSVENYPDSLQTFAPTLCDDPIVDPLVTLQVPEENPPSQPTEGDEITADNLPSVNIREALDQLHQSLESCPDVNTEAPDPEGLKVSLLPHQRTALAWLLWRETQKPCGGILADDMGLGKTLTMIALVLAQKLKAAEESDEEESSGAAEAESSQVLSKGNLIICPKSLIHQWEKEITEFVRTDLLTVYLYYGPNRERDPQKLAEYDVVLTTYDLAWREILPPTKECPEDLSASMLEEDGDDSLLEKDSEPTEDTDDVSSSLSPLLQVTWARLVLDEAHTIKNPKTRTSKAVCLLRARARWAITGAPIHNELQDMYSLLKFLRCSPFNDEQEWKKLVKSAEQREMVVILRSLLLRRTKDQQGPTGEQLVSLPERTFKDHPVTLSEDEKAVYDVILKQSRSTLQNYLRRSEENDVNRESASPSEDVPQGEAGQPSRTIDILSLFLRLRQCCCHLSLLQKTLDTSELEADGVSPEEVSQMTVDGRSSLEDQLEALSISSSSSPSDPVSNDTVSLYGSSFPSLLFKENKQSSKISAIISELEAIRQMGDNQKSVIVSQWTSMLSVVAVHLTEMNLTYAVIDGKVKSQDRMARVEDFNTNPEGPQVMLLSLRAGGVGLNLTGGNHLFLVDMHWNPAMEALACDRIYRVGQRREVTIHRFVCNGTVEQKISQMQNEKKRLAQNVLEGTGDNSSTLSREDLRNILWF